jgi:predicted DNA-binding transcriptional regulator AlpA
VTRRVPVDQMVGVAEIAERLGLSQPKRVHDWKKRYADFPQPVATLKAGLVWDWRDIEKWHTEKWGKATGRI